MAHKKHNPRVPPGNQPKQWKQVEEDEDQKATTNEGAPFDEHDPKRRLGGFEGAGEHAIQQPSDLNDGTRHEK